MRDELLERERPRELWLARPPFEAIFRCMSLSIAANPRLLLDCLAIKYDDKS